MYKELVVTVIAGSRQFAKGLFWGFSGHLVLSKAGVIFRKLGSLGNTFCLARILGIVQGILQRGVFEETLEQNYAHSSARKF